MIADRRFAVRLIISSWIALQTEPLRKCDTESNDGMELERKNVKQKQFVTVSHAIRTQIIAHCGHFQLDEIARLEARFHPTGGNGIHVV